MRNREAWSNMSVIAALLVGATTGLGTSAAPASTVAPEEHIRPSTNLPCGVLTRLLLSEMGVSSKALAAVGADGVATQTIVAVARGLCDTHALGFDAAFAEFELAAGEVRRLEDLAITGRATSEDRFALEAARSDLIMAEQAKAVLRAQVQTVIDASLDQSQLTALGNIVAARGIAVPIEYKVQSLNDQDWVELRDGLVRSNDGSLVPAEGLRTVGDPIDVQAARDAMATNFVEVAAAWEQALSD